MKNENAPNGESSMDEPPTELLNGIKTGAANESIETELDKNSTPEKKKLSKNQKIVMALAGVGLALVTAVGIGSNVNAIKEVVTPEVTTPVEAEVEVEPSESEKNYAEYLKTLSPEQIALRESLNPDALAEMSESEIAEAFTISSDEVMVDGNIDANLYAEAFVARVQAMYNSGISKVEYEKWGGLNSFGLDTIEKVSKDYSLIQSKALYGVATYGDSPGATLTRGSTTDFVIENKVEPVPTERYHLRAIVKSGTAVIENQNGHSNIKFSLYINDNWDSNAAYMSSGVKTEPTNINATWEIKGIHVNESGSILPDDVDFSTFISLN